MIFDPITRALYGDDGDFLKTVDCPLALRPLQLINISNISPNRFCNSCRKTVICIDDMGSGDVKAALSEDASLCVFSTRLAKSIIFLRPIGLAKENYNDLPIVQTARSLAIMEDAQARGYKLVFKNTGEESSFGAEKYVLYQHIHTGKLWWSGDYRNESPHEVFGQAGGSKWHLIKDWFHVRPDRPFPLAAYIVPKDLQPGTRVYLEDVVEDVLETYWNQGNAERILSSGATWDGVNFIVDETTDWDIVG